MWAACSGGILRRVGLFGGQGGWGARWKTQLVMACHGRWVSALFFHHGGLPILAAVTQENVQFVSLAMLAKFFAMPLEFSIILFSHCHMAP